jgi:hypothetical protein
MSSVHFSDYICLSLCIARVSHDFCMISPSRPSWFHIPNNIRRRARIVNLLLILFPLAYYHFLPLTYFLTHFFTHLISYPSFASLAKDIVSSIRFIFCLHLFILSSYQSFSASSSHVILDLTTVLLPSATLSQFLLANFFRQLQSHAPRTSIFALRYPLPIHGFYIVSPVLG